MTVAAIKARTTIFRWVVRSTLMDNHYMDTLAFHAIPGSMIIDKFGYRECPRK